MGAELHLLKDFLWSVFTNWIVLVGGPVVTLVGIGERVFRKEVHWRLYLAMLALFLMCSFYISWRDAKVALDSKPKTVPEINVNEKDPQARADLVTAQAELKDTRKKLGEANDKIQQLQQKVDDRRIDPADREKLVSMLGNAPKGKVIVKADWTDGEALQFARQISDVLKKAGVDAVDCDVKILALNRTGVYMFVKDFAAPPAHAVPIQKAFISIGITIPAQTASHGMEQISGKDCPADGLDMNTLIIWVTRKP